MGKFRAHGPVDIQSVTKADSQPYEAELCTTLFAYIKDKRGENCSKLASELMVEGLTWSDRLSRLCEVVKQGIDTQWR